MDDARTHEQRRAAFRDAGLTLTAGPAGSTATSPARAPSSPPPTAVLSRYQVRYCAVSTNTVAASGRAHMTTSTAAHGAGTPSSATAPRASSGITTSLISTAAAIGIHCAVAPRSAPTAPAAECPARTGHPARPGRRAARSVLATGVGSGTPRAATATPAAMPMTTGLPEHTAGEQHRQGRGGLLAPPAAVQRGRHEEDRDGEGRVQRRGQRRGEGRRRAEHRDGQRDAEVADVAPAGDQPDRVGLARRPSRQPRHRAPPARRRRPPPRSRRRARTTGRRRRGRRPPPR